MSEEQCNHEFKTDGGECIYCHKTVYEMMNTIEAFKHKDNNATSEELKPCPCWGSEVKIRCRGGLSYYISCDSCCIICENDLQETKEEIIQCWNNRPINDKLKVDTERLKALLEGTYKEGWDDGISYLCDGDDGLIRQEWYDASNCKQELENE